MPKNIIIKVQNIPITIAEADMDDYICITDMAAVGSAFGSGTRYSREKN